MGQRYHRLFLKHLVPLVVLTLLVVAAANQIVNSRGNGERSYHLNSEVEPGSRAQLTFRRLLVYNSTHHTNGCSPPSILEFPDDLFTQGQRQQGAVVVNFLVAFYMLWAVAVVCDDFFVPCLEVICDKLGLQTDVAGATFMALGSSAPELFATIIGVFITEGDIGIGTILGSAVFNVLFVVGVCGVFAGTVMYLAWWPLARDSLFYFLSMVGVILVIMDNLVTWPEATVLVCFYFVYLVTMYFNPRIEAWLYRITKTTKPEFKSKLHAEANGNNGYSPLAKDEERGNNEKEEHEVLAEKQQEKAAASEAEEDQDSEGNQFDVPDLTLSSPFSPPDGKWARIVWVLGLPINVVYYFTIPDVKKEECRKSFVLSFLVCIFWIGVTSYVLVWMVTVIGYTFMIPDTIMGLTFVAIGASVPDCLSSLFVARKGDGDMAISHTVGSNVFDILICLGVPWFIKTIMNRDSPITVDSHGLFTSCIVIMASLAVALLIIVYHGFILDKRDGCIFLVFYFVFMSLSVGVEFYFHQLSIPMCIVNE